MCQLIYLVPTPLKEKLIRDPGGNAFGVIFNCMLTRAVHLDFSPDYSTDSFLQVLRRFVAIRGYPSTIHSDNGSQLKAANKQMKLTLKDLEWDKIEEFGASKGLYWSLSSTDAPWQNGCTEFPIRSVKNAVNCIVGEQVLTFSELQTVLLECVNLGNSLNILTMVVTYAQITSC